MTEEKKQESITFLDKVSRSGCVMYFIIAIVIGFIVFGIVSHKKETTSDEASVSEPKNQPQLASLKADIHVDGGMLKIKNLNNYTWTLVSLWGDSIRIKINDSFVYLYPRPIKAGEEIKLSLSLFTNDEGLRFNPLFYRVKRCAIQCKEDFDAWEFR